MKTVGIIGGGQLGRMLAEAAIGLNLTPNVYDPHPEACASLVAPVTVGAFDDRDALGAFCTQCDVVTYEFENLPADALGTIAASGVTIRPSPLSLAISQDRLIEKNFFQELGIATPLYRAARSLADVTRIVAELGGSGVLKRRRLGYDGKGQAVIDMPTAIPAAWEKVVGDPGKEADLIVEALVPFQRELSIIIVRTPDGEIAEYPFVENVHRNGILYRSAVPCAPIPEEQADAARQWAVSLAAALDHVGALTLELFDAPGGLLANEFAPRVHNSGHWTIEGAGTSQFENHIRAVVGAELGSAELLSPTVMYNCIGKMPRADFFPSHPGVHVHAYGKEERAGRKVGHVTIRCAEPEMSELVTKVVASLESY